MLEGDFSLKANIKKAELRKEKDKSSFQRNKEIIQSFLETNIETMLRRRYGKGDVEEKKFENRIMKASEKELRYEMNPYNWELQELENGKKKAIILEDKNEHKEWGKEDVDLLKSRPDIIKKER
jgi:hypothetical protein